MKNIKTVVLHLVLAILAGAIIYYVFLPAINLRSVEFWFFIIAMMLLLEAALATSSYQVTEKYSSKINKIRKVTSIAFGVIIVVFIIGWIISSRIFNSRDYANLLKDDIREEDFSTYQATLANVPLLDKASAIQISNRELGSLVDVVSQFELGENEQTTLNGKTVRVSPLYYGSFFKWLNNRSTGTPGYIKIDMMTQEAELVRLENGIKYSPSEYFGRKLNRYLRFKYPTAMFTSFNFETDEEGVPYWIVPVESHKIGLFGGIDVDYVLAVNAETGEVDKYSIGNIPEWIDNVYNSNIIISQYDNYGSLQNGYWNSIFGQKGVKVTTEGYNYIPLENDNWIYTGITSVGRDESNIGFILSNKRTKETIYYPISGAEEYSAMSSAQGVVQHLGYRATFPLLLNIEGQPTYIMALKDAAGLVKMYAMVNVEKYQIVASGDTIKSCQQKYRELLENNNITVIQVESEHVTGVIESIKTAAIDGNSYYYIKLKGNDTYFVLSAKENQLIILKEIGESIVLDVDKEVDNKISEAVLSE